MKKILYICLIFVLGACVQEQYVKQEIEPETTEPTEQEKWQNIEQTLATQRTPALAAWMYSKYYSKLFWNNEYNCDALNVDYEYYDPRYSSRTYTDYLSIVAQFSNLPINLECLLMVEHNQKDSSDECILARRNNTKNTKVCYYNYKKYLPENTKIKTDDDFLHLVKAFNVLYYGRAIPSAIFDAAYQNDDYPIESAYCESLPETTTAEKAECNKKAENFLNQISNKTVPLCKNTVNKEYIKFISYGGNTDDDIQEFGIQHFCSVTGYEQDRKNINKQLKNKTNSYRKIENTPYL